MRGKVHSPNMRDIGSTKLAREENDLHCGEIHDGRCAAGCRIAVSRPSSRFREKSERSDRIVFESFSNRFRIRIRVLKIESTCRLQGGLRTPFREREEFGDLAADISNNKASQTV